jgi:hypothetical protein
MIPFVYLRSSVLYLTTALYYHSHSGSPITILSPNEPNHCSWSDSQTVMFHYYCMCQRIVDVVNVGEAAYHQILVDRTSSCAIVHCQDPPLDFKTCRMT